jgi:hypothetical protein
MSYKISAAAGKLRDQVNRKYPNRKKDSDGWIGDARHRATKSDHNPDPKTGFVRALDIDSDLGADSWDVANALRAAAKKDKRISYIIHRKKIASRKLGWAWRPYTGSNPHTSHIHVSFAPAGDTDKTKFEVEWPVPVAPVAKPKTTPPARKMPPGVRKNAQRELDELRAERKVIDAEIRALKARYGLE